MRGASRMMIKVLSWVSRCHCFSRQGTQRDRAGDGQGETQRERGNGQCSFLMQLPLPSSAI